MPKFIILKEFSFIFISGIDYRENEKVGYERVTFGVGGCFRV